MKRNFHCLLASCFALCFSTAIVFAQTEDRLSQSYRLGANSKISIGNVSGNVTITAWDSDTVQLDAVKRSRRGDDLNLVRIEIDSGSNYLEVKARYSDNCNCDVSVDFDLKVPRNVAFNFNSISSVSGNVRISDVTGSVKASSVSGDIRITDVSGPVSANSVSGDVRARIIQLPEMADMKFNSVSGNIMVRIPSSIDADVQMETVSGSLDTDFPLTISGRQGRKISGQIGRGGNRLHFNTVSGNVTLKQN